MDEQQLLRLEEGLRRLCQEHGLVWLIGPVDELVAEGQYVAFAMTEPEPDHWRISWPPKPPKKPQPAALRRREYGTSDRVVALVDAMLAVYRDIPEMTNDLWLTFDQGWNGRVLPLETIEFQREDGLTEGAEGGITRPSSSSEFAQVVEILIRIRAGVTDHA